jgi:hypothetical protein
MPDGSWFLLLLQLLGGQSWEGEDDDDELLSQEQVPVTILTVLRNTLWEFKQFCWWLAQPCRLAQGFLGSGKTTLLNYILKANHGMKIAVVENGVVLRF